MCQMRKTREHAFRSGRYLLIYITQEDTRLLFSISTVWIMMKKFETTEIVKRKAVKILYSPIMDHIKDGKKISEAEF